MRYLMYFTMGFTLSCAVKAYGFSTNAHIAALAALLLLSLLPDRKQSIRRMALLLLGCILGVAWYHRCDAEYLQPVKALDGQTQTVTFRITDFSEETPYGRKAEAALTFHGKTYQVLLYLDPGESLDPGTLAEGSFRFRSTISNGENPSQWHQGNGIFLLAYQADAVQITKQTSTKQDIPARLRRNIQTTLDTAFPQDAAPFAKALLLGDTDDLDYGTDTVLKTSGIRHVAAVSGLHVSILFTLLSTLTLRRRWITALLGFPMLLLFAAVAGFTPSVTRAGIMCALMLLAMLVNREYDGPTALSFAVLVMLLANPLAVVSVSLQLSVSSVAGIFLFSTPIRSWMLSRFETFPKVYARFFNVIASSGSISLSAMVLTAPFSAWYFGTVSLIAPLTNLLTLWVISFLFYGLMAVSALYVLWAPVAFLLAKLFSLPIRYILLTANILAEFPLAAVYTESIYVTAWLIFVYCLLILFVCSHKKRPILLLTCAVLGLCGALAASWTEPMLQDTRFTVLDVGQGQCLILQSEGKTIMIDCGGDSDTQTADKAAEYLLSQGISQLDALILTHMDRDHAGAAGNLLTRLDASLLILPPEPARVPTSGQILYADRNLELAFGDTKIQIFSPTFPGNSNEKSLCLLLDTKKCDILITGDRSGFGERALLRNTVLSDVDVLIAGHHGAAGSTCEELLNAVTPEIVCISAGADNPYGHPSPELLRRLADHACAIYRTDQQGTIIIRR